MTETPDNRPEWMIELENRKRKPRLAHEAGAGSPCLSCKEACPGLDLHFWRKICKNCKCGRDEHDVVDDEFPQFDLLLGPSGRPKRKATFLPVAIKKQAEKENAFDWIPPDVTTEIAADYMKALPENKLPIQGSVGAALRKQQLQKQLPLHDMDHKACDKLSEDEQKQFEKYLENLKKYVGQGRVSKVMGARPFSKSLMTPANAADMQPMSPQRNPKGYVPSGESANLRTPSSFIPKVAAAPAVQGSQKQQTWLAANIETLQAQISENANSTGVRLGQYHPALDNVSATGQIANSEIVNSSRHPAQQFANTAHLTDAQQAVGSFLRNSENAQYIPDFGKVNYHKEYSQIDEQFKPNAVSKTVTPLVGSNMDSNVALGRSPYVPNQHIANYENIQASQSISHGFPIQSGQYHNSSLPMSHALESNLQNQNPEMANPSYPGQDKPFADKASQLETAGLRGIGQGALITDELRDINKVPQNISHSNDISSSNAKLAEQMLSDALLPPSAIHANEIIGSTLDRNKLKYIQQQLSAKYSKDELPSQHTLKSQRIDTADPQFGQYLGNKHKNSQAQDPSLNTEANRIAIIAAMRNPSGILADCQKLERIEAGYSNPLEPSGHSKQHGMIAPRHDGSAQSTGLQNTNPSLNRGEYSTMPQQSGQETLPMSQDSTLPLEFGSSDELKRAKQFQHHPMQQQYFDNIPSSAKPDQQLHSLDAHHSLLSDLDNLSQSLRNLQDGNVHQGIATGNYPAMQDPATAVSSMQQNYIDRNTGNPNNEWNLRNPSSTSNLSQIPPTEQLLAELSHQPINSHIIHSQSLGNPSFPEGIIDSPGLRQNPASVDQLRGALEELSVEPIQLHKCTQCKEEIHSGDVVVTAERAKDAIWHPGCFICSTCNELLVDLVYFYHKGKLYCGRDLATLLNIPRCFACDELIFVREYTVAEGHNYHVKHFCCWDCDIPLAGQQYISENDRPLCLPCYQKTYAKTCKTCSRVIAADQQGVAVKNLDFHASDDCFCCFTCKKSLLSGKMAIKEDRPFCSKECIADFLNTKP